MPAAAAPAKVEPVDAVPGDHLLRRLRREACGAGGTASGLSLPRVADASAVGQIGVPGLG